VVLYRKVELSIANYATNQGGPPIDTLFINELHEDTEFCFELCRIGKTLDKIACRNAGDKQSWIDAITDATTAMAEKYKTTARNLRRTMTIAETPSEADPLSPRSMRPLTQSLPLGPSPTVESPRKRSSFVMHIFGKDKERDRRSAPELATEMIKDEESIHTTKGTR
jgi:hypothetical protein